MFVYACTSSQSSRYDSVNLRKSYRSNGCSNPRGTNNRHGTSTGVIKTIMTNASGDYQAIHLQIGRYQVTAVGMLDSVR